jgi:hypothetical protein
MKVRDERESISKKSPYTGRGEAFANGSSLAEMLAMAAVLINLKLCVNASPLQMRET